MNTANAQRLIDIVFKKAVALCTTIPQRQITNGKTHPTLYHLVIIKPNTLLNLTCTTISTPKKAGTDSGAHHPAVVQFLKKLKIRMNPRQDS